MLRYILIFVTFFAVNVTAQTSKIKVKKAKEAKSAVRYGYASIDICYGYRAFNKSYYHQTNSISKVDFKMPPAIIGFVITGSRYAIGARSNTSPQINYYKIIPSTVHIEDTLRTTLSGFVFGAGLGKVFSVAKNFSFNVYLGFNTGRTTLIKNEYISQKNPFFSPKISLQPKFVFSHFAISFLFDYEYDVSNPGWMSTLFVKKEPHLLVPFNQSCFTGLFTVGYRIPH